MKYVSQFILFGIKLMTVSKLFFFSKLNIAKNMILDRDPQEDLRKAFRLFAEDSSGKISFRNLRKIAK